MKKKGILFYLLFFSFLAVSQAQNDDVPLPKSYQKEERKQEGAKNNRPRLMTGGNFGLQFGTYTAVSISPLFGIYPKEWLLVGVGGSYLYSRDSYFKLSSHVFGFSFFAQGLLFKQRLILYADYEYVNYDLFYSSPGSPLVEKERNDCHGLFLGPGYRQSLSDNLSLQALLLFDVIQSPESFYANPLFRVGLIYDF